MDETTDARMSDEDFNRLLYLAERGDVSTMERFIREKKINPKMYYDYLGTTDGACGVICLAAQCGRADIIQFLISLGFSILEGVHLSFPVPRRNPFGEQSSWIFSPIHLACMAGKLSVVKLLVETYKIDVQNALSCQYMSPVCFAVMHGHLHVISYFLNKGLSVDTVFGIQNQTMLHSAVEHGQTDICKFLLRKGANVNIQHYSGITPLMLAAQTGNDVIGRLLLHAGANINARDHEGHSSFLYAVLKGDLNMINLLASEGAETEKTLFHSLSNTPLHVAIYKKRLDIVRYLVGDLNVSLCMRDRYGLTPLQLALEDGCYDIAEFLLRAGYRTPLDPVHELEYSNREDDEEKQKCIAEIQRLQKTIVDNAPSLLALCCFKVRGVMGTSFRTDVERLPLPRFVKNLLRLHFIT